MKVAIVDYGMGNLNSVAKAFEALNAEAVVSSDPEAIRQADRVVLPGVGAFGEGMKNLGALGLVGPLEQEVLARRKPFLGICLGMELLARESFEHGRHEGLGWIDATVQPFEVAGSAKSIHIGWNEVLPRCTEPLFRGLGAVPNFYFVHGYHVVCQQAQQVCATSLHGTPFVSAIQQDNIFGVQFHPEKSQETGLALLWNFLRWNGDRNRPWTVDRGRSTVSGPRSTGKAVPKVRLVPTLLLNDGRLVKTVRFELVNSGLRRDVGHPVKAPMVYDAQLADELVYLDIHASLEGRGIAQLGQVVSEVAGQIFMPLTAGGGIRTLQDIRELLRAGADKVAINSVVAERPGLIREAAATFGSQCVVVSIDARRVAPERYEVFTHSGTRPTGRDPVGWAREAEAAGAGEILLTSIDRDGTMEGYDLPLIESVSAAVNIPVIASGGAGTTQDLVDGVRVGKASAIAAASLFHFRDVSPIKAKAFMRRAGLPVRN